MFDCRACAAKDDEIRWLREQLTQSNDRFQALTGTLSEVANAREVAKAPEEPTADPEPSDWIAQQLAEAEASLRRAGMEIVPEFTGRR